mmetsp:Transcript_23372/g.43960  ORF Transcript_23372/g.43960 Transcript_23372/m.43960 type:complete len:181 (+) Transcript_23372:53-595(+)
MPRQQPKTSHAERKKRSAAKYSSNSSSSLPPWMYSMDWLRWQTFMPHAWLPPVSQEFTAKDFIGEWADSLGHHVSVSCVDEKSGTLKACLSKSKKPDIHLSLKPVIGWSVWQCGNAFLDPATSTAEKLCWLSEGGRVSVWVKLDKHGESTDDAEGSEKDLQSGTGDWSRTATSQCSKEDS